MTPDEAVAAVRKAGHVVIVHKGGIFFNSFDQVEAEKWEAKGSLLVPHYSELELMHFKKRGRHVKQGWEVHFLGACERVEVQDDDGDLVDLTKDVLLAAARAKVSA